MTNAVQEVADAARLIALRCTPEATAEQTDEALVRLWRELVVTLDRTERLIAERSIAAGKVRRLRWPI
jgi:hypothetical protein